MSSAEIVLEVERETAAEVERILAAADRRAAEIEEAARDAVRARVAQAVERSEPAVRADAGRRANEARLRLNERRVDLALARTAAVFDAAATELGEIADGGDRERWSAALGRLAREALELTGPGATVRVRLRDAAAISTVVEAAGGRLEPAAEDVPIGVIAVSADGRIEVDATIPVRLERARSRLAEVVAGSIGFDS